MSPTSKTLIGLVFMLGLAALTNSQEAVAGETTPAYPEVEYEGVFYMNVTKMTQDWSTELDMAYPGITYEELSTGSPVRLYVETPILEKDGTWIGKAAMVIVYVPHYQLAFIDEIDSVALSFFEEKQDRYNESITTPATAFSVWSNVASIGNETTVDTRQGIPLKTQYSGGISGATEPLHGGRGYMNGKLDEDTGLLEWESGIYVHTSTEDVPDAIGPFNLKEDLPPPSIIELSGEFLIKASELRDSFEKFYQKVYSNASLTEFSEGLPVVFIEVPVYLNEREVGELKFKVVYDPLRKAFVRYGSSKWEMVVNLPDSSDFQVWGNAALNTTSTDILDLSVAPYLSAYAAAVTSGTGIAQESMGTLSSSVDPESGDVIWKFDFRVPQEDSVLLNPSIPYIYKLATSVQILPPAPREEYTWSYSLTSSAMLDAFEDWYSLQYSNASQSLYGSQFYFFFPMGDSGKLQVIINYCNDTDRFVIDSLSSFEMTPSNSNESSLFGNLALQSNSESIAVGSTQFATDYVGDISGGVGEYPDAMGSISGSYDPDKDEYTWKAMWSVPRYNDSSTIAPSPASPTQQQPSTSNAVMHVVPAMAIILGILGMF
jgi:hypothetical protein